MKLEQYQDEEKDQMRQAANETIRTLHKMLIEKNKSLSQKESTITALRDEMADERKRAADKYVELQRQYTDEGKSTLAGL
jgi:metal-responsive CopG/Arc/MetJ family transcriptional regulator